MNLTMKQNIIKTIGLVVALFGLLYIGKWMNDAQKDEGPKLFHFEKRDLVSIGLNKARIALKEGGPFLPTISHPADPQKVDSLIEKLKGIRIVKELDAENKEEFFSHQDMKVDIETSDGVFKSRIGDVTEVTGNFYGEGKNAKGERKVFLLQDISFYEGFYKDELELKLRKYWELKKLLNSSPIDLADKRLFRPEVVAKARRVRFDPKVNRWFEIDLIKEKIRPAAPKGVREKIDPKEVKSLLLNVTFESFVDKEGSVLEDLLSMIEISGQGENLKAELFGKMDGRPGLYAKFSNRPERTYFLQEKGRDAFFVSAQRFYDKRPELKVDKELEGLKFSLGSSPGKMDTFVLEDEETFTVRGHKGDIAKSAQQRFNLVFNALFASNGFEQASRVRELGMKEMEDLLAAVKEPVYMEFLGKTFVFALKGSELFLWDLEERLEFVYQTGSALKEFSAKQFFALER